MLAWQLGRRDAGTYAHVKAAVGCLLANGPQTPQERWENQGGYSPATIAAEIAGLVTAADLARANGDTASAAAWDSTADDWQSKVDGWTATSNGPYSSQPYYLRLTKDGNPNAGTPYDLGDSGPQQVDQRKITDPSYLELVRLGVKPASSPTIRNTLGVVDGQLGVDTPNGRFWHRYNFDGYGEKKDGSNWDINQPINPGEDWIDNSTIGRIWPIFAGERGEYELAAGDRAAARGRLASMARDRRPGPHDRRAGLGPVPALGLRGLPARRGDAVGLPARVVARPARAARVVDRRRPPGRAAEHRGAAVRRRLGRHRTSTAAG